jgi:hypothetical protein
MEYVLSLSFGGVGYPVSPRTQRKPARKPQQKQQATWRWSKNITAVVFIAWAILGVCFLTGTWLPHHEPQLVPEGQSQAGNWRLLSLLQPGSPRRLLEVPLSASILPSIACDFLL